MLSDLRYCGDLNAYAYFNGLDSTSSPPSKS